MSKSSFKEAVKVSATQNTQTSKNPIKHEVKIKTEAKIITSNKKDEDEWESF